MERQLLIFSAGAVVGAGVVIYGGLRILCIPAVTKFLGAAAGDKFADWLLANETAPRRIPYHRYSSHRSEGQDHAEVAPDPS